MQYEGPDRRMQPHCDMHDRNMDQIETNTEHITTLSSSYNTLKYVVGICLPLVVALISGFFLSNQDILKSMAGDMKEVKQILVDSQIKSGKVDTRLDNIEQHVRDIENRIDKSHPAR